MITTHRIMGMLTERGSMEPVIRELIAGSDDFKGEYQRCANAMDQLKGELGEDSLGALADAIERQAISHWIFAGALGFRANLEHFQSPVARTFIEVDPEVYLREGVARAMPEYVAAQETVRSFCSRLSREQRAVYEDIAAYIALLETVIPKVAHYNGFMLGNELLPRMIPGYQPDVQLTMQYRRMMEKLLG